jgi:hypothetical protein
LIKIPGDDFLQTLRSKLNWGLDVRNWFYSFKNEPNSFYSFKNALRDIFQMNKMNYTH